MRAYRRSCAPVHVTVTEPEPQTLRLTLDGELDATAGPLLRDVAAAVVWAAPMSVEIDAAGLEFVDVRGLRALGDMWERLEKWVAVSLTHTSRALDRLVAACAEAGGRSVSAQCVITQ
jgi:hypothetical protein